MRASRPLKALHLILYLLLLYTGWSLYTLILQPWLAAALAPLPLGLVGAGIKLLVWTLPALCLVRYFESSLWISLRAMLTTPIKWLPYLGILGGFFVYNAIGAWIIRGRLGRHPDFALLPLIGTVLFVGITEEAVFRGWLLNAALSGMKTRPAVMLNAALFVCIHFPIWILREAYRDPWMFGINCAGVFLLGLLFAGSFIRSRNIWVPIVLHMGWNLCNTFFYGA